MAQSSGPISSRAMGVLAAVEALGKELALCRAFVAWGVAPESKPTVVARLRAAGKMLVEFADDLEREWSGGVGPGVTGS